MPLTIAAVYKSPQNDRFLSFSPCEISKSIKYDFRALAKSLLLCHRA